VRKTCLPRSFDCDCDNDNDNDNDCDNDNDNDADWTAAKLDESAQISSPPGIYHGCASDQEAGVSHPASSLTAQFFLPEAGQNGWGPCPGTGGGCFASFAFIRGPNALSSFIAPVAARSRVRARVASIRANRELIKCRDVGSIGFFGIGQAT
jgi:hypothetical protein